MLWGRRQKLYRQNLSTMIYWLLDMGQDGNGRRVRVEREVAELRRIAARPPVRLHAEKAQEDFLALFSEVFPSDESRRRVGLERQRQVIQRLKEERTLLRRENGWLTQDFQEAQAALNRMTALDIRQLERLATVVLGPPPPGYFESEEARSATWQELEFRYSELERVVNTRAMVTVWVGLWGITVILGAELGRPVGGVGEWVVFVLLAVLVSRLVAGVVYNVPAVARGLADSLKRAWRKRRWIRRGRRSPAN